MAKIIELIYTEERRGTGESKDPTRLCPQLWTKDGTLVAEKEPCFEGNCKEELMWFFPNELNQQI